MVGCKIVIQNLNLLWGIQFMGWIHSELFANWTAFSFQIPNIRIPAVSVKIISKKLTENWLEDAQRVDFWQLSLL